MSEPKRLGAGLGAKLKAMQRGRKDLPSVRAQSAQGHSQLDATTEDGSAVSFLLQETHSATARRSIEARVAWWSKRAVVRGLDPFPLNESKL